MVTQKVDIHDDNLGSFHRWIAEFAKHFSHITVVANSVGEFSLPQNVRVISLGKEKGVNKLIRLYRFWEFFSYYYAHSQAVFFHMIPEFVVLASPFLLSHHKPSALWYVHKSVTKKLKWAERLVGWVFTASEASFRLPSKKVIYTGHAIDTALFSPVEKYAPPAALRLVSAGRISPVKDYETLIKACAILKKTWQFPWVLSIVGGPLMPRDHEYLATIKKAVKEYGLENLVLFHGSRPFTELPAIYQEHDMFVSMSTTGSVDKAVLEAMSSGLTVLTANEAFKEIILPPYFIEKRSAELLADRIKMLAGDPRPNLKMREIVKNHHGLSKTITRISQLLRENHP